GGDTFDVVADATQSVVNEGGVRLLLGDPGFANPVEIPNTPPPAQQFYTVFTDVLDQWGPSSFVLATLDAKGADVIATTNLNKTTVDDKTVAWASLHWPGAAAGDPCGVRAPLPDLGSVFSTRFYIMSGTCLWREQNQLWSVTLPQGSWR